MTKEYFLWHITQLLCRVTAEKDCVESIYGIAEDVWLKVCCSEL